MLLVFITHLEWHDAASFGWYGVDQMGMQAFQGIAATPASVLQQLHTIQHHRLHCHVQRNTRGILQNTTQYEVRDYSGPFNFV